MSPDALRLAIVYYPLSMLVTAFIAGIFVRDLYASLRWLARNVFKPVRK